MADRTATLCYAATVAARFVATVNSLPAAALADSELYADHFAAADAAASELARALAAAGARAEDVDSA